MIEASLYYLIISDGARNLAIIIGTILAILTLVKGIYKYTLQTNQKRAEYFMELQKLERANFKKILELLEIDSEELKNISYSDKIQFLAFYENIALMMNSNLIKKNVAYYMFGYYALRCWDSKNFWYDIEKNSFYWSLFKYFVIEMQKMEAQIENKKHFQATNYKL